MTLAAEQREQPLRRHPCGVAVAELDERTARIESDLAELEAAGDDATNDLVERLRGRWTTCVTGSDRSLRASSWR